MCTVDVTIGERYTALSANQRAGLGRHRQCCTTLGQWRRRAAHLTASAAALVTVLSSPQPPTGGCGDGEDEGEGGGEGGG